MEETRLNSGVLALIIVASLFAGWQTVLLIGVLLLIFGKIDENSKKMLVTVITFLAGVALFSLFWDLIVGGVSLFTNTITDFVSLINSYLDKPIEIYKLQQYLLVPLKDVIGILDRVVDYAIIFIKFAFITSILTNKNMSNNFLFKKINAYVEKFSNYVSKFTGNLNNNNSNFNQMNNNQQMMNQSPMNNGMFNNNMNLINNNQMNNNQNPNNGNMM